MELISEFLTHYAKDTPHQAKLIDIYLIYCVFTGVIQFLYCIIVGGFPFNSFLSGFISCVGSFILAVCLRMQVTQQKKDNFKNISVPRAFADFLFCNFILHYVVINFLG